MIRDEEVRWGISQCEIEGCFNDAELIFDDLGIFCIRCADVILERRIISQTLGVDALRNLPPIGEWYQRDCPVQLEGK